MPPVEMPLLLRSMDFRRQRRALCIHSKTSVLELLKLAALLEPMSLFY
jgi:hypothetical protein